MWVRLTHGKVKAISSVSDAIYDQIICTVARMAYDDLTKSNPAALKKANTLLKVMMDSNPDLTKCEKDYPFVESVTLADTIKMRGGSW